ncbi:ABC transporter permease [Loktanella sp. D2R18]|uniref:ABC transporter permease n=1 Tax=Rhodobacterales TaxID=204455 RepID=UPI000DE8CAF0|nr:MULTISPECIES: ABC transporter permease [Rhodobacterales]MDO6590402.1 ABC transporter permease [Yoonia sp. 1_MG-2023]RBW41129.1 ABC transporter permease [Loktanella sp. D2R18]
MFQTRRNVSTLGSFFSNLDLIYEVTVRSVRGGHRNAVVGLVLTILQSLVLVAVFLVMFMVVGVRSCPIPGEDFLIYIMSGVMLFRTHVQSVKATQGANDALAPMMLYAPMNPIVTICASALATLYQQLLAILVVLTVYHCAVTPIYIDNPIGAMGMFLLAWFSGCCIGVLFLAITPWFPRTMAIVGQLYRRMNMIASGKMFLVNSLPASMIAMFDWNPLFHIIDQNKGFVFLDYNPHFTTISYPLQVSLVFLVLGMMGMFFTRQHVSASWSMGK